MPPLPLPEPTTAVMLLPFWERLLAELLFVMGPSWFLVGKKGIVELVVVEFIDRASFSLSYPFGCIVELFLTFFGCLLLVIPPYFAKLLLISLPPPIWQLCLALIS